MLSVRNLEVTYGGAVRALRGVSVDVGERGVVAVLGSNGAGKTTLVRAVSGVLSGVGGAIDGGTIELAGRPLTGRAPSAIVDAGVVQVPEGRRIFSRLTVEENLRVGGFSVRDGVAKSRTRNHVFELFPVLHDRRRQRAGLLSGGQQQMLAIGRALMAAPKLLLLDEPSLGLAPQVVGQIGEVVREINRQGTAVLLIEQNATMALQVATAAVVLTVGEVSLAGTAAALAADERVRALYLSGDGDIDRAAAADTTRPRLGRWVA